jgi:glutathione S-transferase
MPTLYYVPGSAAMAPHAALEEAGVEYDLARVERDNGRAGPEYLAINPLGRVPAYVDGALVLWESAAIVLHLADRYPDAQLLPPDGSDDRAVAVRWLVYLTNTVQATFMHFAYPGRLVGDDPVQSLPSPLARDASSTRPSIRSTACSGRVPTCSARPSRRPTSISS